MRLRKSHVSACQNKGVRYLCLASAGSGFGQWTPLKQEAIVLPDITAPLTIEARTENRLGRVGANSCVTLTP